MEDDTDEICTDGGGDVGKADDFMDVIPDEGYDDTVPVTVVNGCDDKAVVVVAAAGVDNDDNKETVAVDGACADPDAEDAGAGTAAVDTDVIRADDEVAAEVGDMIASRAEGCDVMGVAEASVIRVVACMTSGA
jgi:hypothetical protein